LEVCLFLGISALSTKAIMTSAAVELLGGISFALVVKLRQTSANAVRNEVLRSIREIKLFKRDRLRNKIRLLKNLKKIFT